MMQKISCGLTSLLKLWKNHYLTVARKWFKKINKSENQSHMNMNS